MQLRIDERKEIRKELKEGLACGIGKPSSERQDDKQLQLGPLQERLNSAEAECFRMQAKLTSLMDRATPVRSAVKIPFATDSLARNQDNCTQSQKLAVNMKCPTYKSPAVSNTQHHATIYLALGRDKAKVKATTKILSSLVSSLLGNVTISFKQAISNDSAEGKAIVCFYFILTSPLQNYDTQIT